MENLMHVPWEEQNLRMERLISHKCMIYRKLNLIYWPMNIYQEFLPILKPMNLTALILAGLLFAILPVNAAQPKPSMDSPVACYSMHFSDCSSSAIPEWTQFQVIWACLCLPPYLGWQKHPLESSSFPLLPHSPSEKTSGTSKVTFPWNWALQSLSHGEWQNLSLSLWMYYTGSQGKAQTPEGSES